MNPPYVEIVENFTVWNTDQLEAFCNEFVHRCINTFAAKYGTTPQWGKPKREKYRPIKLSVFDWAKRSTQNADWCRTSVGLYEETEEWISDELQLMCPSRLVTSPLEVVAVRMGIFSLRHEHYTSLGYRLFSLASIDHGLATEEGVPRLVETMLEDKFQITAENHTVDNKTIALGRIIRQDRRKIALRYALRRQMEEMGEKYYDRYMQSMASSLDRLRAAYRKDGLPVEVLSELKAQLRQDLDWLESITSDATKIVRPESLWSKK